MYDSLAKQLQPVVRKAAEQAARRWNGMMPAEDIEQELWLFIFTRPSVQEYLNGKPEGEQVASLKRPADSICSQEKIDYDHFTGNYHYTPADARSIVGRVFSEKTVLDEERIDFEIAVKDLHHEHPGRYEDFVKYYVEEIPAETGAEQKNKERAIGKLTDLMNRKRSQREVDAAAEARPSSPRFENAYDEQAYLAWESSSY